MANAWGVSWGVAWGDSWGSSTPAPPTPSGSVTVPAVLSGFTAVGVVTVGTSLIRLSSSQTAATVLFCTGENNTGVVYIGDGTMTTSDRALLTLSGASVRAKFENQDALNTIPLGNITLLASAAGQIIRISVLVT